MKRVVLFIPYLSMQEGFMKNIMKILSCVLAITAFASAANPPQVYVHVIYYDFRADGSNPEFEMYEPSTPMFPGGRNCACGPWDACADDARKSLVLSNTLQYETLNANYFGMDSIAKPVVNSSLCNSSKYLKYWFRDWSSASGAKGKDFTKPVYVDCQQSKISNVGHDRSFENIVIKDSLLFNLDHSDIYTFVKNGACDEVGPPEFYPIDGKGFGNEGKQDRCGSLHNFCFTTEMHMIFEYKAGLSFMFKGDDNVWMFIDGKLVMDVNGLDAAGITLNFNSLGLIAGKRYALDFFHVERHTDRSRVNIITNVLTVQVKRRLR
jgi:fibro-slime domain-containing protein